MAVVHRTTLTPGKLELLASWLPAQPWYDVAASGPVLAKAGGFRLDDPAGQVGIEFMVATDSAAGRTNSYHLPLTYRGSPLPGGQSALVGESEHGVLGHRWVYDGVHDPVLMTQLAALLEGSVHAQAQSVSDTPDESVVPHLAGPRVALADIQVIRVLQPSPPEPVRPDGYVEAGWLLPDGTAVRGLLVRVDRPAAGRGGAHAW